VPARQDAPISPLRKAGAAAKDREVLTSVANVTAVEGDPAPVYDPKYVKNVKRWIVQIDVTDNDIEDPIKCELVTATVTPVKADGEFYKKAFLGFARPTSSTEPADGKATAIQPGPADDHYYFTFVENDGTKHKKTCLVSFE
jgi:hypothetical protein